MQVIDLRPLQNNYTSIQTRTPVGIPQKDLTKMKQSKIQHPVNQPVLLSNVVSKQPINPCQEDLVEFPIDRSAQVEPVYNKPVKDCRVVLQKPTSANYENNIGFQLSVSQLSEIQANNYKKNYEYEVINKIQQSNFNAMDKAREEEMKCQQRINQKMIQVQQFREQTQQKVQSRKKEQQLQKQEQFEEKQKFAENFIKTCYDYHLGTVKNLQNPELEADQVQIEHIETDPDQSGIKPSEYALSRLVQHCTSGEENRESDNELEISQQQRANNQQYPNIEDLKIGSIQEKNQYQIKLALLRKVCQDQERSQAQQMRTQIQKKKEVKSDPIKFKKTNATILKHIGQMGKAEVKPQKEEQEEPQIEKPNKKGKNQTKKPKQNIQKSSKMTSKQQSFKSQNISNQTIEQYLQQEQPRQGPPEPIQPPNLNKSMEQTKKESLEKSKYSQPVSPKQENLNVAQKQTQKRVTNKNSQLKNSQSVEEVLPQQKDINNLVILDGTVQRAVLPEIEENTNNNPQAQRHIAMVRYTNALRKFVLEKFQDQRLENLQHLQLCQCGALDALHNVFYRNVKKDCWQQGKELRHRFQCANNCMYYGNHQDYAKALADVIHTLQEL